MKMLLAAVEEQLVDDNFVFLGLKAVATLFVFFIGHRIFSEIKRRHVPRIITYSIMVKFSWPRFINNNESKINIHF